MINFYRKTAALWTLTRVFLILLLITSIVIIFIQVGLYLGSAISFLVILNYLVLLGFSLFRKNSLIFGYPLLRATGIFTLIYGVLAIISIVQMNPYLSIPVMAVMALFSLWLLLFGLGDILNSRKVVKERNSEHVGADS